MLLQLLISVCIYLDDSEIESIEGNSLFVSGFIFIPIKTYLKCGVNIYGIVATGMYILK